MSQAKARQDAETTKLLAGAAKTIASVRYCWLSTAAGEGDVRLRPMGHLPRASDAEDAWTIRFVTDGRSRKASDIKCAGRAVLVFQHDPSDAYVTLTGKATLRQEASEVRQRWNAAYDIYFPTEVDRANAAFIEVDVERMELWIRGVTPEPYGMRATTLERDAGGGWRQVLPNLP